LGYTVAQLAEKMHLDESELRKMFGQAQKDANTAFGNAYKKMNRDQETQQIKLFEKVSAKSAENLATKFASAIEKSGEEVTDGLLN
jgi:hypothetical protein